MRAHLARLNTPGLATAMLLSSLGATASAQQSKPTPRQLAEDLCGTQLLAFEASAGATPSPWQGPAARSELPAWMTPESARIRVWAFSALALVDTVSAAPLAVRSSEFRDEAVVRLGAGLAVTKCLTPTDDHWRGAEFLEDDTFMAEDQTFIKEMRSTECFVENSEDLLEVLVSDLEGAALQDAIEEQIQVRKKPCETKD